MAKSTTPVAAPVAAKKKKIPAVRSVKMTAAGQKAYDKRVADQKAADQKVADQKAAMSPTARKAAALDEVCDTFEAEYFEELSTHFVEDYKDCLAKYWQESIDSGKITLEKYQKIWRKDIFDKERLAYHEALPLFDDVREKYGAACVKKMVGQLVDLVCIEIYQQ